MARYSTFGYGAQKYGASTPEHLIWGLEVDWDDDGGLSGAIEAGRMVGLTIERGRNYLVGAAGESLEAASPGRMEAVLENGDGRYDAFNTSSPLYPNVAPGRFIKLRVRSGSTAYDLFSGTIQNIRANPRGGVAVVSAEDGLRWLQDMPASTPVYENIYAGQAIGAILDAAEWPAMWGRNLARGADVLEYWWGRGRSGLEEIRAVAGSELGHVFQAAGGQFVFRSRHSEQTAVMSVDQTQLSQELSVPQPWEIRRNLVYVSANPINAAAESVVWTNPKELVLSPGASTELIAEFGGGAIDVAEPAASTDYTAYSQSGGLGSDLTGSINVAAEVFAETARVTVTNMGGELAYVNFLQLRGRLLNPMKVTAMASTGARRPQKLSLDLEWQQDVNNPAVFAGRLTATLSSAGPTPEIVIESRPEIQFGADLFDLVDVSIAALNIAGTFRIGKISHRWQAATGQAVQTTWRLEPYDAYSYWRFPATFNTTSILGW